MISSGPHNNTERQGMWYYWVHFTDTVTEVQETTCWNQAVYKAQSRGQNLGAGLLQRFPNGKWAPWGVTENDETASKQMDPKWNRI